MGIGGGDDDDNDNDNFFKVTSNLRGATLADFFFVKKVKVRQLRYHFPKKCKENIKTCTSY